MIEFKNIEELEREYKEGKIKREFVSTGIKSLDEILGGGITSGLTILGGKPGYGKTTLAFQIASNIKQLGKTVLFYSYEMPATDFAEKSLKLKAALGNVDAVQRGNLYIVDAEDVLIEELVKSIEAKVKEYGEVIVVIDYLQIIQTAGSSDVRANVEKCVRLLAKVAKKHKIPIILLSSLSREAYRQKTLEMSAFKESGAIESSAVTILGIESSDDSKNDIYRNCTIRILKNRYCSGKDKVVSLAFQAEDAYFREEDAIYCI